MGVYKLEETDTSNGYIKDEEVRLVQFIQEDFTTTVYDKDVNVDNKITKTVFNKTDITGEKEVPGANMSVADKDGNIIDEWTSTDEIHEIDGLLPDNKYILKEILAPEGYVKASDIEFTVNSDGEIQTVEMKDKQISVSKLDSNGNEIIGAKMNILDADGNVVDEWFTDGKPLLRNGKDEVVVGPYDKEELKLFDVILFRQTDRYVLHRIIQKRDSRYLMQGDGV